MYLSFYHLALVSKRFPLHCFTSILTEIMVCYHCVALHAAISVPAESKTLHHNWGRIWTGGKTQKKTQVCFAPWQSPLWIIAVCPMESRTICPQWAFHRALWRLHLLGIAVPCSHPRSAAPCLPVSGLWGNHRSTVQNTTVIPFQMHLLKSTQVKSCPVSQEIHLITPFYV